MTSPEKFAGKRVRCKACGTPVVIGRPRPRKPKQQERDQFDDEYEDYEAASSRPRRSRRNPRRRKQKHQADSFAFAIPSWAVIPLAAFGGLILLSAVVRNAGRAWSTASQSPVFSDVNPFVQPAVGPAQIEAEQALADTQIFHFQFVGDDLDGRPLELEAFRGSPVIINVSATWCPACREQYPVLAGLDLTAPRGVEIVGLICEDGTPPSEVKQKLNQSGVRFPCAIASESVLSQVPNLTEIPTTIVLDAAGTVRLRKTGHCSMPFLNAVLAQL
jgi:thiol-disulfide isomerase/thioredoxin